MTQRIELFFVEKKKTQTNEFLSMTHRNEPLFLNFFKMTQRVEVFFQYVSKNQNVSKNWTFFFKMLKELNLSFIWTTFLHDSTNWTFSQFDSKSWAFFLMWLKELDFFLNMTRRINFFFLNMTQRSELCWTWPKEVSSFEHYSKNRTLFF